MKTNVVGCRDAVKGEHHAVALDQSGERLFDRPPPNDAAELRELIGRLKEHGRNRLAADTNRARRKYFLSVTRRVWRRDASQTASRACERSCSRLLSLSLMLWPSCFTDLLPHGLATLHRSRGASLRRARPV